MKDQYVLTLLECSGIQDYIFSTNNLGVNIGASENVFSVTGDWLFDSLPKSHNLIKSESGFDFLDKKSIIAGGDLNAEVVYFGGGNALIIFKDLTTAKNFAKNLSENVLFYAPKLQLSFAHEVFSPEDSIADVYEEKLLTELKLVKGHEIPSSTLNGLAVTAQCVFTGQPANFFEKVNPAEMERHYISMEVKNKLDARPRAETRMHRLLPQVQENKFDFVYNFEDFGTAGVSSYIGVVHIDGNGMGKRFSDYSAAFRDASQNEEWVKAEREYSESIKRISRGALAYLVDTLLNTEDKENHSWHRKNHDVIEGMAVKAKPKRGEKDIRLLPLRPLVFGGDDVTLVADGRLSLAIARAYLDYCSSPGNELPDGKPMYSRAGIAIVHSHFPFSRAYEIAESLLDSGKNEKEFAYPENFFMDWHFATSAMIDDLATTRLNEYAVNEGDLLMRPILLTDRVNWRTWKTLESLLDLFQTDEEWAGKRGKQKALRDALREGPSQVELFEKIFLKGEELPLFDTMPGFRKTGWQGGRCGYFDSLEATDLYLPLEG